MSNERLVIVDYGMGNLRSVQVTLERLGSPAAISSSHTEITNADRLILPGVGHFGKAMSNLKQLGLVDPLTDRVLGDGIPILGICLGMQLLFDGSEEGDVCGLAWIRGKAVHFDKEKMDRYRKIPHIGWNSVSASPHSHLFQAIEKTDSFYFVHNYHINVDSSSEEFIKTKYGYEFVSAVEHALIFGTQFHPEKSHDRGARLLSNFLSATHRTEVL